MVISPTGIALSSAAPPLSVARGAEFTSKSTAIGSGGLGADIRSLSEPPPRPAEIGTGSKKISSREKASSSGTVASVSAAKDELIPVRG
jgi:hypothetical protein